ncbi:MAG: ATP-binding protein [Micavibrio sp.]
MKHGQSKSFLSSVLAPLTGADELALEKARLEAFLNAFPGEYCGFHDDGSVAYSDGFCALLGLPAVERVEDVQAALTPTDSSALEGQFLALEESGKNFSLIVRTENPVRTLRLRGNGGAALDGGDRFRILWAEDVSDEEDTRLRLSAAREAAEKQLGVMEGGLKLLPVPVWLRDGTGALVWANDAYPAMLRIEPGDVIPAQEEIILSSKAGTRTPKDMAREALNSGTAQTGHAHAIIGGKRRWMELNEIPLPGTHHTLGMALDLTAEEEGRNELERHITANKELLEQLRSGIALFGADQTLQFFNTAYAAQWGLEEQWLNNRPRLGDILEKLRENRRLPEEADFRAWKQSWLDMFTRLIEPHDDMLYLPDGSAVRVMIVPHTLGGLAMIYEDVTNHLQLESSYNTLVAVQKETLDNLAEGVVVFGGDGRLKLWNPAFAKIWDLNPEELEDGPHINKITDRAEGFFEEKEWPAMRTTLVGLALSREAQEGRLVRRDGLHLKYATVPLPDGGVMASYYDISDSSRVENALREKNAALEAAEQLKTDFLANVSYQLRTPLNAIMGFSEILENEFFGTLNERQMEYAAGIHESGEKLVSLIDDILDLSTIEAGYLELNKEKVPLKPLLENLESLVTEWARKRNLSFKLNCPPDIGTIEADSMRLKQALLNLTRNAINFTDEGGKIEISAKKSGDSIEISVSDTGVGIAQDDLERILAPFERTSAGKNNSSSTGAGIGLALVKSIIQLHGGSIAIESELGKGTKVSILL